MKTIRINDKTIDIATSVIHDHEFSDWLNIKATYAGETLETGAWIADDEDANRHNERAGIAGGMRQGVAYPNATWPGDLIIEDGDQGVLDEEAAERFADAVYGPREDPDDGWGEMGMLSIWDIRAEIVAEVEKGRA